MSDSRKSPPLGIKKVSRASSEGVARAPVVEEEITGQYEGEDLELRRSKRDPLDRVSRLEKKQDELRDDVRRQHDELKSDVRRQQDDLRGEMRMKHDELRQEVRDKHSALERTVSEVKLDVKTLSGDVSGVGKAVSGVQGQLEGQAGLLGELIDVVKKTTDREHVTFTAKVEVDKERELAKVEVDKEKALTEVEVEKNAQLDKFAARRARRKLVLKAVGLLAGGGAIVEVLHQLVKKL